MLVIRGTLLLALLILAGCTTTNLSTNSDLFAQIEFRLGQNKYFSGSIPAKNTGTTPLFLSPKRMLTHGDVTSVTCSKPKYVSEYRINISLSVPGSERLATTTAQNVGKTVVIFIHKEQILSANIFEPITGGVFTISGMSQEEAIRVCKSFGQVIEVQ